jgi:hypothetical protein
MDGASSHAPRRRLLLLGGVLLIFVAGIVYIATTSSEIKHEVAADVFEDHELKEEELHIVVQEEAGVLEGNRTNISQNKSTSSTMLRTSGVIEHGSDNKTVISRPVVAISAASEDYETRKNNSSAEDLVLESSNITSSSSTDIDVDCLSVRGEFGEWVRDTATAARFQYMPIAGFRQRLHNKKQNALEKTNPGNFTPTVMEQTVYSWNETRYQQCQLKLLMPDDFCKVLQELKIQNLFFVGDSMTQAMYFSFIGLFFREKTPPRPWAT